MSRIVVVLLLLLGACSTTSNPRSAPVPRPSPVIDGPSPASASHAHPGVHPGSPSAYRASVRRIGPGLRDRMRYSHGPGCPVPVKDLRYLRMRYVGFDGQVHTGEMVVHEVYAEAVTHVFERLYDAGWPIHRMRLVDDYRADDDRSMAANNTSGYNCRRVAGTDEWSAHAYGAAVDVNPVQNPYLSGASVRPPAGRRFATIDRSTRGRVPAGVIRTGGVVVRAFARIGWEWGGDWSTSQDYQHFFASAADQRPGNPRSQRRQGVAKLERSTS